MTLRIRTNQSPFAALIDQLRGWEDERAELMARLADLDAKVAKVAVLLDVEPPAPAATAPAANPYDGRRKGAMIETALELLNEAPNGLTRLELKAKLREHPVHGERLRKNENGFYNMVIRALRGEEIAEHGERLFAFGKGPTVDHPDIGAFDFSGGKPV